MSAQARDAAAEAAFSHAMEGRQYGEEETRDAHAWFMVGWRASRAATIEDVRKAMPRTANHDWDDEGDERYNAALRDVSNALTALGEGAGDKSDG